MSESLIRYLQRYGFREPDALRRVRDDTAQLPDAHMQLAPEQAQLMALLARLIGARRYLELGTYTGYSALAVALALPPEGRVTTCDINEEFAALAMAHWRRAGVADRIEVRLGPALETLDAMLAEPAPPVFDMAFIDADKNNVSSYYERCLSLIRTGGLLLVDNTLWSGSVADPGINDAATQAIRAFNAAIHSDTRVEMVMLPVGDGLTIARKVIA